MKLQVTEQYLQDNSKCVLLSENSNKQYKILREYCNSICSSCGLESSPSLKDHFINETLFQETIKIFKSSWKDNYNNYSMDIKYFCDLVYNEESDASLVVPWLREFCVIISINDLDIIQRIIFEKDKISSVKTYTGINHLTDE